MMKETTKKINFMPYYPKKGRVKDVRKPPTVNVFVEAGRLQFGRYAVEQMQMEGKFVRFFYEPIKKIIGWKVTDSLPTQEEMKIWKVCKTHNNGVWQVSIRRMLEEFQGRKGLAEKYKDVEVKRYREQGIMSQPSDTYFFIELKEEYNQKI